MKYDYIKGKTYVIIYMNYNLYDMIHINYSNRILTVTYMKCVSING